MHAGSLKSEVVRSLKRPWLDFLKGGDGSLSGALSEVAPEPGASWKLSSGAVGGVRGSFQSDEVMGRWEEGNLKLPSALGLLSASSLDSQSFMMAPSTDEVARSLRALTSKCLRGKNYCRQVLCLYELAKVCARGPTEHCLRGKWEAGADFGHCSGSSSDDNCERERVLA